MEERKWTDQEREFIKGLVETMSAEVGFFRGNYDAHNGSDKFMHGVGTVMEYLAYLVSDDFGDDFSNEFIKNMIESEKKVLTKRKK